MDDLETLHWKCLLVVGPPPSDGEILFTSTLWIASRKWRKEVSDFYLENTEEHLRFYTPTGYINKWLGWWRETCNENT